MFQTWAVKIMRMQATSRPTFVFGKIATMPSTSPGRNPRTGIHWRMSRIGSITFSARRSCAASSVYEREGEREEVGRDPRERERSV